MPRKPRFFWPPRYLDEIYERSLAEILGGVLVALALRSRQDLAWSLAKILGEFLAAKISARISVRFWDLSENLSEFLAAKILRSHQDLSENLDEILRSRQDLAENLGKFLAAEILRSHQGLAEISPRSHRDLGNLPGQKLAEILAGISVKILGSEIWILVSLRVFRAKRQYFMPPRSRLGFREETQNYAKRNRSQILF